MEHHEVIIIGGGPAGLALAAELSARGIRDLVVLEREMEAGGTPRHCGHRGYGMFAAYGLQTGPQLAARLRAAASGAEVRCGATVLEFTMHGNLRVHTSKGITEMSAGKIVLATGTRESSRAARLLGGNKAAGVMNTGELQQRVYFRKEKPFQRPVIIGAEWVSFSSLLTCRHLGIKPVAMLAEKANTDVPSIFTLGARLYFGVPVLHNAQIVGIRGNGLVEAVQFIQDGKIKELACDGVVISGEFRSESALYGNGFLVSDGHSPKVTECFKTSRANIYAVGNVLGQLETAGNCMKQARQLAKALAP